MAVRKKTNPHEGQPVTECALEAWRSAGGEEGKLVRESLRRGVEEALLAVGQGFLAHPQNTALRAELHNGTLRVKDYFDQLLRLVYRLIFLLTVEERGLLHPAGASDAARARYAKGYCMRRLRARSVKHSAHGGTSDLWNAIKTVCNGLAAGEPHLGLPALAGIFSASQCPSLDRATLDDSVLLFTVFKLTWRRADRSLVRVNWRAMGPEELGSVYESLLELVPQITQNELQFVFGIGSETKRNARKTSGSYYTPDSLVQVILDGALEPVIAEVIAKNPGNPVEALLGLSIVDPSCGSGHFVLAAARRLAAHVARFQANRTPSAREYRHALRQVVGRCVFGVDLNPMAVELCKVGLWLEAAEPGLSLTFLDSQIQQGNALFGTTPERMAKGIPDTAWGAIEGDDKKTASTLKRRNKKSTERRDAASEANVEAPAKKEAQCEGILGSSEYRHQKFVADAWCAAFVWPKQPGGLTDAAPTNALWRRIRDGQGRGPALTAKTVGELAERYGFFHWHLQFSQVFTKGGFDVVLGNPPWIAHGGRAAQALPPGVKHFYETNYDAFADYPTTHGLFVGVIPRVLREGGYVGVVVPSSVSELGGYAPTRTAHDRLCEFVAELTDFGEGRFDGVTQPCMALVSRRTQLGRRDAEPGEPWPVARPDLTAVDRQLLARMKLLSTLPPELFGERGLQSDKALAEHFVESREPTGRFTTPIREGTDVREFELLPPRFHVDSEAIGNRLRSTGDFAMVRVVVRQTARYPIAALSDGVAFRNSLLAGFELEGYPPEAVVALLNSALIRWLHYQRFRDARQPVMPQVKIGHLRAIPIPASGLTAGISRLTKVARAMVASSGDKGREALDDLVAALYGLSEQERRAVTRWHEHMGPRRTTTESPGNLPPRRRKPRADGG